MLIIVGFIIVVLSVLGGFVLSHGKLGALWQPYEVLIICGAAFGAYADAGARWTGAGVGFHAYESGLSSPPRCTARW